MTTEHKKDVASFLGGARVKPSTLVGAPVLADGQIQPVTDQPGINLYVRKSGVLVPAVETVAPKTITTEPISMVVDPVSGVSPPAGTIVTKQSEYDALGAPLRYAQDALRILPPVLGDYVKVRLVAGEHWGMAGSIRTLWVIGRPACVASGTTFIAVDPVLGGVIRGSIYFYGDTSVYTAVQSGTYSAPRTIACPTGTWSVNELQGKWVWFLTGSGAGQKLPIRNNTATSIEVATPLIAGSGTFEIRQNDSYIIPTTNGTDTILPFQILAGPFGAGAVLFYDLRINKPTKTGQILNYPGTHMAFIRCNIHAEYSASYGMSLSGRIYFSGCQIVVAGPYPVWCSGVYGNHVDILNCMIRGKYTATGAGYPGLFTCYFSGELLVTSSLFEPTDGTFTKGMIGINSGLVHSRNSVVLDGLGTAQGILLGGGEGVAAFESEGGLQINNTTTAVSVAKGGSISHALAISGSGNTTVFNVSGGERISWRRSALSIVGTDYANIDGQVYASSYFASDGDKVIGQYGSSLEVTP